MAEAKNTMETERQTGQILLLEDDGRMARLLRVSKVDYEIHSETYALQGIVQLSQSPFNLVLLNVERLGKKVVDAVRALRQIHSEVPILLFGGAFVEGYAGKALRCGANDFLVWPIPIAEIRKYIPTKKEKHESAENTTVLAGESDRDIPLGELKNSRDGANERLIAKVHSKLITDYQKLARLIPQGNEILIHEAEKRLAETLRVEWVRIREARTANGRAKKTSDNSEMLELTGPLGLVGLMELGPALEPGREVNTTTVKQAGDFIGTLLYLAQRDASLKYLATVDELTGAYNRRYLEHFLRQMIERNQKEHTEVTLLLFDIDEFKYYNDTYGHSAGDEVLQQATVLMQRCCRAHDVVTRMGGDEFAVVFWDSGHRRKNYHPSENQPAGKHSLKSHPEMVLFLSNRFRRIMQTSEFTSLGPDARGVLTISGGLASYPWDGKTVEELLAKADDALLQAKRSGKNRIYLVGQPK
jgi:PleD family two-component response regulator